MAAFYPSSFHRPGSDLLGFFQTSESFFCELSFFESSFGNVVDFGSVQFLAGFCDLRHGLDHFLFYPSSSHSGLIMAINVYTGLMGSGKSYEVVAYVLLPAVASGRNVVTNIDGINTQAIYSYILKTQKKLSESDLGKITVVDDDSVRGIGFFPSEDSSRASIVQPGDLVVIDEAWRHWDRGQKLLDHEMAFFRMHRHYTHPESGVSCDLALIFQSISDVSRSLRDVVEMNAKTNKLKSLGLSKGYTVTLYEGSKQTKHSLISRRVRKYKPHVFPFYKSYSGEGEGKEAVIDKRQSLFNSPVFIFAGIAIPVVLYFSLSHLFSFFSAGIPDDSPQESLVPPMVDSPFSGSSATDLPKPVKPNRVLSGRLNLHHGGFILVNEGGSIRIVDDYGFTGKGVFLRGDVDGVEVSAQ